MVEHGHVGVHIVQIVRVRRVLLIIPQLWSLRLRIQHRILWLGLVIHAVEADYVLK